MIKFIIPIALLGVALYHIFPLIQVVGDSMYPTYKDSEIIFGTRIYRKIKVGDVIVYKSPNENRTVIKRVAEIKKFHGDLFYYCLGDNLDNSYDSRYYGSISSKSIVCKVINQRRNENQ